MKLKKNDGDGGGGGDAWLNTYADMVTLLLTFFVMLFTMSSIDAEKWKILVEAFSTKGVEVDNVVVIPDSESDIGSNIIINPDDGSPSDVEPEITEPAMIMNFDDLYNFIKQYVEEKGLESSIEISRNENSVFIRFEDNVFFDPDKSYLRYGSHELLNFLGDCFLAIEDQIMMIRINGHTASVPNTTKKSGFDRTLSSDRANSVLLYFEEMKRIEPKKLISIGYGRNYPIAENDTEEGRTRNRRVEIMILSNELGLDDESELFEYILGGFGADIFDDSSNSGDILLPDTSPDDIGDGDPEGEYENVSPYDD